MQQTPPFWGANKTLADYVKESAWQSSAATSSSSSSTTSMPWATAVKMPPDHSATSSAAANNFDYTNTIGSWNSSETGSSSRAGGWNADGSMKHEGAFDDGTAIWGNPITKKAGLDWTDKESLTNPPLAQKNSNSEKRIQKAEPTISSINGTEAWGAPIRSSLNSQQQKHTTKNDISGNNNFGMNSANESNSWGESSSLQGATSDNSSPPNSSIWNNLGVKKQHSSDWLSGAVGLGAGANNGRGGGGGSGLAAGAVGSNSTANLRLEELSKQLESTSLFDPVSAITKGAPSTNPNLDHHQINVGSTSLGGGTGLNDLKQMSANYSNDLLDSPNRHQGGLSSGNNQQSQQLDSAAYPSAASPSRDLLKQMVHQIQLAVQAGHLNAHILNQPMSTPTLQLVYQLLQQIKTLHQLQEIQQRARIKSDPSSPSNLELQINRIRQNISLLQKAITQQQAALTKNDSHGDSGVKQQANSQSYATISKLSTNSKVPPNNMSNTINNSNLDSFRRSSLIDTLSNSNSDSMRSAQATFDANATTIDKTLSSFIQASSANNILGSGKTISASGDFSKAQGFTSGNISQQQSTNKSGFLSAQSSTPSSAWSAFSSGDFVSQQGWPSQLRISLNASQDHPQHQYSAFDMMPEFGPRKDWRNSPVLLDGKDAPNMAPGNNISVARPNSASNTLKQMNENDILSRDSSFCDWGNNSDSSKRNFDHISNAATSFSSSAIGSLSLQTNPWMFAPTSSASSLNMSTGMDNQNKNSGGSGNLDLNNKSNNGNTDKMAGDSLFLKSGSSGNIQRSSSALYDWGNLGSSTMQFGTDNDQMSKQQASANASCGSRPAPPPGLMSNFGSIIGNSQSANRISTADQKSGASNEESQMQSRESSSSLWSGAWFD